MANEDFRSELNRAIDDLTGPPGAALSQRVRSAVADHGRERSGPFWIAGVAAAVIALILISVLVIGGRLNQQPSAVGAVPRSSPTPTATPSTSPTPSSSPAASASAAPAFVCSTAANPTAFSNPGATQTAFVDALRPGAHEPGYDRLTIEFSNGEPATIQVQPQRGTAFTKSPSGQAVTLRGTNGILVTIHGADAHTSYSGSRDLITGYRGLVEVEVIQDFEGVVQLALGVSGPVCYSAHWLANPGRLVVDVAAS